MAREHIDPWITEEYAKERDQKIRQMKAEGKDPFQNITKEKELEFIKQSTKGALRFNQDKLNEMEELGAVGYIEKTILDLRKEIIRLENPTDEERYKFTKAYFNDLIKQHKETLVFFEEFYKDKDKLNSTLTNDRERTKKHIEKLQVKLDKINSITKEDLSNLDIEKLKEMLVDEKPGLDFEETEILDGIIPQNFIIPNNRLINKMSKNEVVYNKDFDLKVNSPTQKETLTKVNLNYNDENIQIYDKDKRFTPYDRAVHNSICSLFEAGNINFTPEQTYRCMNGLDDKQYVSPQAVGAITRSIDKSRRIMASIDYTSEAKGYNKQIGSCIIEDYILSAKKVMLEAGGHKVTGYKLNAKPILYEYAQVSGQILTVPSQILNTKDILNSTQDVIIIREYLIRRIEVMKKNKEQSNNILFNSVYEELGLIDPTNKKTQSVRKSIKSILSYWVSEKYIKKFEFYKEGRSFKGISIVY